MINKLSILHISTLLGLAQEHWYVRVASEISTDIYVPLQWPVLATPHLHVYVSKWVLQYTPTITKHKINSWGHTRLLRHHNDSSLICISRIIICAYIFVVGWYMLLRIIWRSLTSLGDHFAPLPLGPTFQKWIESFFQHVCGPGALFHTYHIQCT